jgi:hypothetical protein
MKKIIFLFTMVLLIGFTVNAQRTITVEVEDNAVFNSSTMQDPIEIQVLATNVGGTTDGTVTLQGSVDGTTFQNVQPTAGTYLYFPDDTTDLTGYTWTMTDAGSLLIGLEKRPFTYYRIQADGTVNDTTTLTIKWIKWNRDIEAR